jgi:3-phosphoshikimate 1-carboxyvinyltransferase
MKLIVSPSNSLSGQSDLPGDKSISHRATLLASLAYGHSHIGNFLSAGVTEGMLRSLTALGVDWRIREKTLTVEGFGLNSYRTPAVTLGCGNSATTMRLMAGALAASGVAATLDGTPGLRQRPMRRLIEPLQSMGVPIQASGSGGAPLVLAARPASQPLKGIDYTLPVASAQVKSALLLAALAADGSMTLREPGPSRDHTERMLKGIGMKVTSRQEGHDFMTIFEPSGQLEPLNITVPGDISSAAFLIVAALIVPESEIILKGVGLNPTRTGLLDALAAMGADIHVAETDEECGEPVGEVKVWSSYLKATRVSGDLVVRMIDEFPIFAVAAAYANGKTVVENAEELRYKESDRIVALCQELRAIGVDAKETADGFIIQGRGKPSGGTVDPHGDHRLAMALAVAGLAAKNPVNVRSAEIIDESFPGFIQSLRLLGADLVGKEG